MERPVTAFLAPRGYLELPCGRCGRALLVMNGHSQPHVSVNGASSREPFVLEDHSIEHIRPLRVAIIGAGLSGVIAGILLPAKVPGIQLTIFEKNADVGGTWYENTYPGIRCDIPAHVYQTSFSPNTQWTEEFAQGPELLQYWKDLAAKYDVYQYLKPGRKVTKLEWHADAGKWDVAFVDLERDEEHVELYDVVLPAIGRFNDWRLPEYPGLDEFAGTLRHTSHWDSTFDATNKRIAIIGNGASGIQLVPTLQKIASRIDHYARSPTWIARSWAGDVRTEAAKLYSAEQLKDFEDPAKYLEYRKPYEDKYWRGMPRVFRGSAANEGARSDSIAIMKQRLQAKPELLDRMIPEFSPNCRRPTPGPGYLEALCQDNVEFIQDPIRRFTKTGIETADGQVREVDAIFCATGANRDLVPPFPIIANGVDLRQAWTPGNSPGWPENYMGIATPRFPNLFWLYGPQAGGLSGSVPHIVENLSTVVGKILRKISTQGIKSIVPSQKATDDFTEFSETFFTKTVLTENCSSWYNGGKKGESAGNRCIINNSLTFDTGGRIHGLWPGSAAHLTIARREPRWEDWEFEYFSRNRFAYLGNGWTDAEQDPTSDMTYYLKLPDEVDLRTIHE